MSINPRKYKPKKVTQRGKGGGSIGPFPSTFDTIYLIDLIFGTCNELSLYFHHINDIARGGHLGFSDIFHIRTEQ